MVINYQKVSYMFVKLIVEPAIEPVTADELRDWLRGPPDPDDVLMSLITAARQYFEAETNRALITQTMVAVLDQWPFEHQEHEWWDGVREGAFSSGTQMPIKLMRSPLIEIEKIEIFDDQNVATVLSPDTYYINNIIEPGLIHSVSNNIWPTPDRDKAGIKITYKVGYGSTAADVPALIKTAIKQAAAHFYENREAVGEVSLMELPQGLMRIIGQYRVWPGV